MADTGGDGAGLSGGTGPMLAALLCAIWQLCLATVAAWLAVDQIFGDARLAATLLGDGGRSGTGPGPDLLRSMIVCTAGSLIGGVMNGLFYLQFYAAERGRFSYRFVGSYLIAPLAIGLIGLTAFALVTGGIIVFAAGPSGTGGVLTEVNLMAYLALGIISGIAWKTIMARVQDAADNIFGKNKRAVSRGETGEGGDGAATAPQADAAADRQGRLIAFDPKDKG